LVVNNYVVASDLVVQSVTAITNNVQGIFENNAVLGIALSSMARTVEDGAVARRG
jgi:hypothetical protein